MNNIVFTNKASEVLADFLKKSSYKGVFVFTDTNVNVKCLPLLELSYDIKVFAIEAGEDSKNLYNIERLWKFLSKEGAKRNSLLINVGGGVVTDMGGFAASCFKRGMDFVNIPTTLLAQIDASVGSKTGFDFYGLKNEIGLFADAKLVIIDSVFLKTLEYRQFMSGYAEMFKHALLKGEESLYDIMNVSYEDVGRGVFLNLIKESVAVKESIVDKDPYEKSDRKALNLGHTIGHAIETYALSNDIELYHGDAVALGIVAELYLSVKRVSFDRDIYDRIRAYILCQYPYFQSALYDFEDLCSYMLHDKKNEKDGINVTLLESPGKYIINNYCSKDEILEALKELEVSNIDNLTTTEFAPAIVDLPGSKSISNRVLIISALESECCDINGLADCDDTYAMLDVLSSQADCFNVGHAGTAMRFLTAFLAKTLGVWELRGSERMHQRPIAPLVAALNALGADVRYMEKENYPPLIIYGHYLKGGTIDVDASVSSQFITALMLIAPYMHEGLMINLIGKVVSAPYIRMTARIMQYFGVDVEISDQKIVVSPGKYVSKTFDVEKDWSAASYFYALLAVRGNGLLMLSGLKQDSMQGDSQQAELWEKLGVNTEFIVNDDFCGIRISYGRCTADSLEYNFSDMPDLLQTFVVVCCLKGVSFHFTGLETLKNKETDRLSALSNELEKLSFYVQISEDSISWEKGDELHDTINVGNIETASFINIETYNDHRMAMAFAPALFLYPTMLIDTPEVVCKSFPNFWRELKQAADSLNMSSPFLQ